MLIRVRGGEAGIREYLEEGRKDGRDYSRAELDERVILAGDLKLTDAIINDMDKQGERYLHITLAFKEEEISRERLKEIADEFQKFAMTAYDAEEYNFYAEAHLPKLKSYTSQKTGEFIERKPHIHIVIPEHNLLSQRNLNPFGKVDQQTKFLEAFQEHINAKYGIASPKDNRRIEFTDESAIISRYKGDYFQGANHELKERILSDVIGQDVTDFDQFRAVVARHGETKTRNAGKVAEYLNVKPEGAAKGINLKDQIFSREFIELPTDEKRRRLAGELHQKYEDTQPARPTRADIAARLNEWHEVRAAELKYLNSGNRKAYAAYRAADPEQRRAMLAERAAHFYAKHRPAEIEPQPEPPAPTRAREPTPLPSPTQERDGRPADTVVGQRIAERNEAVTRGRDTGRAEFDGIKRELDASRLLAAVSRTHGVIPEKYEVTKSKDGSDRIRCGRRNLNVSDFLTQELHLPWREAVPILRRTYAEQQRRDVPQLACSAPRRDLWAEYRRDWQPQQRERREQDWMAQRQREQERRAELRRQYQAERRAVQNDRAMKGTDRKAALSLARMEKVKRDIALREQIERERAELKNRYRMKPADQYRAYLAERASRGDADALAELRRQRMRQAQPTERARIEDKDGRHPEAAPIMKPNGPTTPAAYKVDRDGNVTYYDQDKQAMFTDTGAAVEFDQTKRAALETGLRLALAKFGPHLKLSGTEEYKHDMADVAADAGLYVEFSDKVLQERYEQRREAIKAGRAYMAQAERAKTVQGSGPDREAEQERQEPEQDPTQQKRGRER